LGWLLSLIELGFDPALHDQIVGAALTFSSIKGNPVALTKADARTLLQQA
jgi:alcohol dehydrogenase class IV